MGLSLGGDLNGVGDILLCAWGVLGLGKRLEQRGCGFESWCCETLDEMPPSLSLRCLICESEQQYALGLVTVTRCSQHIVTVILGTSVLLRGAPR